MYDESRMQKLKELRSLLRELALEDENGVVSPDKLEEVLSEAGEGAEEAMEPSVEVEITAGEPEEDEDEAMMQRKALREKFYGKKPPASDRSAGVIFAKPEPMKAAFSKKPRTGKIA